MWNVSFSVLADVNLEGVLDIPTSINIFTGLYSPELSQFGYEGSLINLC